MPKLDLRPFGTNLEAAMLEDIRRVADERRLSQADVVRDLLRRGLKDWERERDAINGLVSA